MNKIRILQVIFAEPIEPWELDAFRGAIAGVVGKDHILFHNHNNTPGAEGYVYRYPRIQYKLIRRRPVLYCLDEGVEEIHHFFREHRGVLLLNGRSYDIKVQRVKADQFVLQVWDNWTDYHISKWHPIRTENYKEWNECKEKGEPEKMLFLEKILRNNIVTMLKHLESSTEKDVKVRIQRIVKEGVLPYKHNPITNRKNNIISISADFSTNVVLPEYIGLGSHVSVGYGMVRRIVETK